MEYDPQNQSNVPSAKSEIMFGISRYPRALENRLDGHDKAVVGDRRSFLKAALLNFAILQLVFFGLFCYLFGSIFRQDSYFHNLKVLYVDYDDVGS